MNNRITVEIVEGMYRFVDLKYEVMLKALREMGKEGLLYDGWTSQNPFKNQSYLISEVVYHFLAPKGSEPWKTPLVPIQQMIDGQDREKFQHWVKWPNNQIVDLGLQHFETIDKIPDYKNISKKFSFRNPSPNAKTKRFAKLLGVLDED